MIILDKPYVSEFFLDFIISNKIPVLKNNFTKQYEYLKEIYFADDDEFIQYFKNQAIPMIYSNSENSIDWMIKHLDFTNIPKMISLFKNKFRFRELIKSLYPTFHYQEVTVEEMECINPDNLPFPFIIKPTVGFFSMGVYKVNNRDEWKETIDKLKQEIVSINELYPLEVIDATTFIIEEVIEGEEFAVDAYYNSFGKPVILNIFKHIFSSEKDVSDRVYITSKEIIDEQLASITDLLIKIGELTELSNFPIHIEVRINENGITPIELNPMRFAGWCTTDIAYYAYGINVYDYYFNQKEPDWNYILKGKENKIYSIIVGDLPRDVKSEEIKEIDYKKFLGSFTKPLDIRKIDYSIYPVFAFLFAEFDLQSYPELQNILTSDLKEYIVRTS